MSISERLLHQRKKAGLTQKELADKLGISYQSYAQYERGVRKPKYETLSRFAKALNCNVSELLDSREEAQMIVNRFLEEKHIPLDQRIIAVSKREDGGVIDAFKELKTQGSVVQEYTVFVANHPLLMQLIKELGIEFELNDWHTITICYDTQRVTCSISSLIYSLKLLHEQYVNDTQALFKNDYGFDMNSYEED